jgi:hypothetical protein
MAETSPDGWVEGWRASQEANMGERKRLREIEINGERQKDRERERWRETVWQRQKERYRERWGETETER